ncbi:MAG: hypothetical protein BM557_02000 [Flavobacterium sp. MedPE-SWcel]|uniref:helix-turn-helix domain-containing protein n=1 Tax=uncultured Flavobacterium sp. TaxID=165435 RepID=UPI000917659C|nr:helix-turn-helix domain-containing protein [uncultured Flavobacterium sp.]OIQ22170.1 MAG: hypothetical protein BM557_02000 [Flavobacterium sp. MedPE-SWcel]
MIFGKEEAIAFRKELKLTQEQLAKAFKITKEDIAGYERGEAIPMLILKRYQMYKRTGNEKPEDFTDIGDFGNID